MNLIGLVDEYESAALAVAAMSDALLVATPFNRRQITARLREAQSALVSITLELLDALHARMKEAA